ncbi:sigma factor-like helix-turn-helix DNA-binding protein [Streptomyces zagrosensis]|uniref:DNA-directed RNA polymerase specialized sigma24 family protein n=1 Tax=Streptomyces zagrosensis TaxID=1042984 RepID=A0A7W9V1S4_9ACTN|nr:sigma-70 region 4 domain-containing protein [Streptomyces zagrosensis]MBB5938551.1 DNA-directed RNA polymerase specialized sigma24 family protein [Streptomyces zagrosensis]
MNAQKFRTGQDPVDFLAFRELVHLTYLRYAQARLKAPGLAQAAVDAAFTGIRRSWPQFLSSASAPQAAWRHLRDEVSRQLSDEAPPGPRLTGPYGDAVLLHRQLGMPLQDIADVMGVTVPCVQVLLVRADRECARRTG